MVVSEKEYKEYLDKEILNKYKQFPRAIEGNASKEVLEKLCLDIEILKIAKENSQPQDIHLPDVFSADDETTKQRTVYIDKVSKVYRLDRNTVYSLLMESIKLYKNILSKKGYKFK